MNLNFDPNAPFLGLIQEEPKPEYDHKQEERLQRIARTNALGEAFRVLSDAVGGHRGGTIVPREQNQPVLHAFTELEKMRDKYGAKTDKYNDIVRNIKAQEIGYHIGEKRADDQRQFQSGERQATQEFQAGQAGEQREWQSGERKGQQTWQSGENALDRQLKKDLAALSETQAWERLRLQAAKDNKPFYRLLEPGNRDIGHDISESEFHAIINAISELPGSMSKIKLLGLALGDENSKEKLKLIIQDNWDKVRDTIPRLSSNQRPQSGYQSDWTRFLKPPAYQNTGETGEGTVLAPPGQRTASQQQPQQAPQQQGPKYTPEQATEYTARIINDPQLSPDQKSLMLAALIKQAYPHLTEAKVQEAVELIMQTHQDMQTQRRSPENNYVERY
jgi:hypothetical protein